MQDLHKEGDCRQLEFWTWKSYVRDTYSAHLQMSWNFTKIYFGINKKYWKQEVLEGATQVPTRHQCAPPPPPKRALVHRGAPGQPLAPIFWYISAFSLEKIWRRLSGWCAAVSRRNLGRSTFALRQSDSVGDTSLREGEIGAIDITNDPLIMGGSIFINIFTSTISSQTLVHLLYSIFVSKP